MSRRHESGFTIIETMLFLAVSAALAVAVLVGVSTSINTQRYRDAVVSFQTFLQEQYSEVANVYNSREPASCASVETHRGRDSCVILGRYIAVQEGGAITTASVLGYENNPSVPSSAANDVELLHDDYTYSLHESSRETALMQWGTEIAWPESGSGAQSPTTPRSISILILRSPGSGMVHTFSADYGWAEPTADNLRQMIIDTRDASFYGRAQRTICVDSTGWVTTGGMAVFINDRAASANAIETRSNDMAPTGGAQC